MNQLRLALCALAQRLRHTTADRRDNRPAQVVRVPQEGKARRAQIEVCSFGRRPQRVRASTKLPLEVGEKARHLTPGLDEFLLGRGLTREVLRDQRVYAVKIVDNVIGVFAEKAGGRRAPTRLNAARDEVRQTPKAKPGDEERKHRCDFLESVHRRDHTGESVATTSLLDASACVPIWSPLSTTPQLADTKGAA